jgi:hypothetical protein
LAQVYFHSNNPSSHIFHFFTIEHLIHFFFFFLYFNAD